jgi:hypothetical protein
MSSTDGHSDTDNDASSIRTYPPPPSTDLENWLESAAFALAAVTIGFGHYFLSMLIMGGTFYYMHITSIDAISKSDVMRSVSAQFGLICCVLDLECPGCFRR